MLNFRTRKVDWVCTVCMCADYDVLIMAHDLLVGDQMRGQPASFVKGLVVSLGLSVTDVTLRVNWGVKEGLDVLSKQGMIKK